jgi:hypothetical protein
LWVIVVGFARKWSTMAKLNRSRYVAHDHFPPGAPAA